MAVPAGREQYWALDMATSAVPHNKILLAARLGRKIPTGWVTDKAGHPITDPAACNFIGQRYYGPVVLVTNALCYSATDIFTARWASGRPFRSSGTGASSSSS